MSPRICPECNQPLPENLPAGMCPTCLLQVGLTAVHEEALVEDAEPVPGGDGNRAFGDYVLESEIARGGMGVVFRARQRSLNRTVALKLVHGGIFATPAHRKRFQQEAQAAGRLHHPNIVSAYEVGEQEGQPFFSMPLVEGGTLLDALKRRRFRPREAASLMTTMARAVNFAHQRGVLHRDLKPTNILLDTEGQPHITDFGLAKLLEEDSDLTVTLAVMGTPAYMSPEQAGGKVKDLTTASDIYSLGVILYELLCGHPPFAGTSTAAVLRQVIEDDPQPLRKENPEVDADLETIGLKCMEKEPGRRYGSAGELADELERWLDGRPILARPTSAVERLRRWAGRNPVLAAVSTALVLSLMVGGFMLDRAYRRTRSALHDSILIQARAQLASKQMGQRFEVLSALKQASRIQADVELRTEVAAALARSDARLISRWPDSSPGSGNIAFTPDLAAFLSGRLQGGCELRSATNRAVLRSYAHKIQRTAYSARYFDGAVFSRDGKRFGVTYHDKWTDVWDLTGSEPLLKIHLATSIDFTPDGTGLFYYNKSDGLTLRSLTDGSTQQFAPPTNTKNFIRLDLTGTRLATTSSSGLEVWDLQTRQLLWSRPVEHIVHWAAWSQDDRLIAMANAANHDILLLDADSGRQVTRLAGHLDAPDQFAFHPNGHWLASSGNDGAVRIWSIHDGQQLLEATTGTHPVLQFSPDGTRIATGAGIDQIGIAEISASEVFREFRDSGMGGETSIAMANSANSRLLVTASTTACRVWDVNHARELLTTPRGMPDSHSLLFFGPDDKEIIYSCRKIATLRIPLAWSQNASNDSGLVSLGMPIATGVRKNSLLLSTSEDKNSWLVRIGRTSVEYWPDANPARRVTVGKKKGVIHASLSPDHRWSALSVEPPADLEIWDTVNSRKHLILTNAGPARVGFSFFSPDGRWLVGAAHDGHHVWEVGTWKHVFHFPYESAEQVVFAQGGRLMALHRGYDEVEIRQMPEGRSLLRLRPPQVLTASRICMNEVGTRLWLLGAGHRVYEWNLGKLRQEFAKLGLDWKD